VTTLDCKISLHNVPLSFTLINMTIKKNMRTFQGCNHGNDIHVGGDYGAAFLYVGV
jgi:hypothetical protein